MNRISGFRRSGFIAAALALLIVAGAHAASLDFLIKSNHSHIVSVEFYSQDSDTSWPGDGKAFLIKDDEVHRFPLEC